MQAAAKLVLTLFSILALGHEGLASPATPPAPPTRLLCLGTYYSFRSEICNCTSNDIHSDFCHEEEFEVEVGGSVITVKTGKSSSQCDLVTIPPGKCVSQSYKFKAWKSCGLFFTTYSATQVGVVYDEYAKPSRPVSRRYHRLMSSRASRPDVQRGSS